MVVYKILYTKKAAEDIPKLKAVKLDKKAKALIEVIRKNPYQTPPPRLVYEVFEEEQTVKIISLWTHYEF